MARALRMPSQFALEVIVLTLTSFSFGCGCEPQSDFNLQVAARINGEVISRKDLRRFFIIPEDVEPDIKEVIERTYLNPANKRRFMNRLITRKLLLQEAKRRGLDERADFQDRVKEFIERELLKDLEVEIEGTVTVSDHELREHYDSHREKYQLPPMVRLRQIRVARKRAAERILDELSQGADFAQLATARSSDLFATAGGDIGYYPEQSLVPEVRRVVSKLKVGDVSGLIPRPSGYMIVKLTDRRKSAPMAFEEVKEKIRGELLLEKKKKLHERFVARLRAKSHIEMTDWWLKRSGDEWEETMRQPTKRTR